MRMRASLTEPTPRDRSELSSLARAESNSVTYASPVRRQQTRAHDFWLIWDRGDGHSELAHPGSTSLSSAVLYRSELRLCLRSATRSLFEILAVTVGKRRTNEIRIDVCVYVGRSLD
jgi:hypothetical protein